MTLIPFNYNEQQLRVAIDISTGKARRWKIPRSAIRAWLVNHNNQTARRSA